MNIHISTEADYVRIDDGAASYGMTLHEFLVALVHGLADRTNISAEAAPSILTSVIKNALGDRSPR